MKKSGVNNIDYLKKLEVNHRWYFALKSSGVLYNSDLLDECGLSGWESQWDERIICSENLIPRGISVSNDRPYKVEKIECENLRRLVEKEDTIYFIEVDIIEEFSIMYYEGHITVDDKYVTISFYNSEYSTSAFKSSLHEKLVIKGINEFNSDIRKLIKSLNHTQIYLKVLDTIYDNTKIDIEDGSGIMVSRRASGDVSNIESTKIKSLKDLNNSYVLCSPNGHVELDAIIKSINLGNLLIGKDTNHFTLFHLSKENICTANNFEVTRKELKTGLIKLIRSSSEIIDLDHIVNHWGIKKVEV